MVVVSHAPAVHGFANDLSYSHPNGKEVALVNPGSQARMRVEIADRMLADRSLLDALRAEIRPLRDSVIFDAITRTAATRGRMVLLVKELVDKRNNIAHRDIAEQATRLDVQRYARTVLTFCGRADRALATSIGGRFSIARPW
jgi:hypothetical protein